MTKKIQFSYEEYQSIEDLSKTDAALLLKAQEAAKTAYAPYSNFFVGAAAILKNGKIVTGSNQENASYPVTICAERSLLAAAAALYNNVSILTMAISYHNQNPNTDSSRPISPCGMCRQSLLEYETKYKQPIKLILGSYHGKVLIVEASNHLLPLSFTGDNLK